MTTQRAIVGLGLLGFADACYMLAYHEGWIDRMWCPFFGAGCEIVGRSPESSLAGVPNAAVGVAAYAGMAALAAIDARARHARPAALISWWPAAESAGGWPALGLAAISSAAVAASGALIWEMGTRVRAWCFWCLMSAGINAAICALAWSNMSESVRRRR